MRRRIYLCALVGIASLCGGVVAIAAGASELKCPISGHPASKQHVVEHNGGQVYFCCAECAKKFTARPAKFAAKANRQLVQSGQFKLVDCPLEGYGLNPVTALEVGGVKVLFCCKGCRNVVRLAKNENERINLVFGDKPFKKGFAKVAATDKR